MVAEAINPVELEHDAITSSTDRIAVYLQEILGQKIVAYLAGLTDPKMVGAWARGESKPRSAAMLRMRCAYQAAGLLTHAYGKETAQAWFFGSNHLLEDEAPAYVLRYAKTPGDLRLVVPAARAFIGSAR